jgi:GMP synthase (glutamine-hydrolysing)
VFVKQFEARGPARERNKAAVFQHVACEDLGSLEQVLIDHGFRIDTFQLGVDDLARAYADDPELLIVLGGPISVNDGERFPFLAQELAIVRARLLQDTPCIGICLGAQLMSLALGGRVAALPKKQIGWSRIALSDAVAANDPLRILGEDTPVLHWHGEELSLPEGAVPLARSEACANQAFSWQRNGLGLQFHPEVTARGLERWYVGHNHELSAAGCDIPGLRAAGRRHAEALRGRAQAFLHDWLTRRGL